MIRNTIMRGVAAGLAALCLSGAAMAGTADNSAYIRDLVPEIRDLVGAANGLSGKAKEIVETNNAITMRETGDSIVLSVTSDVLFGFDSAELTGKARSALGDIVKILDGAPDSAVRVVGYTDSKGSDSYNMKLSKARANAVADFLVKNGVAPARLKAEGRGEGDPVAPNEINGKDNPAGRSRNRRVEFVLPKA